MLDNLVYKLTDYGVKETGGEEDAIDETYGVAVVFEEEEEDEGKDQLDEVQVRRKHLPCHMCVLNDCLVTGYVLVYTIPYKRA